MARKPLIGVPASFARLRFGHWHEPVAFQPSVFLTQIHAAGGIPLLIPEPALVSDVEQLLDQFDGLLLAGGSDIDPALYHQPTGPHNDPPVRGRDELELALTRGAIARDMPVLGFCRGSQLLNLARGGDLIQHLPDVVGSDLHRRHSGTFVGNDHFVELEPGSLAARVAGETRHRVFCHHHQAIGRVGEGLRVTGRGCDGTVEAIELPGARFVLGVQWHPEADPHSPVIDSLVTAAAA